MWVAFVTSIDVHVLKSTRVAGIVDGDQYSVAMFIKKETGICISQISTAQFVLLSS